MLSQLAGAIKDATGSFTNAYFLAAGMLVLAAVLTAVLKSPQPAAAPAQPVQAGAPAGD